MQLQPLGSSDLKVTRIGYGCMSLGGSWETTPLNEITRKVAVKSIRSALDEGINFFDHADIYTRGKSEEAFSAIWADTPRLREQIYLQTKCGIRFHGDPNLNSPDRYDFSYDHIMDSVHGSLRRLKTDYLDVLLLHRPDPLVEPEEVAHAFDDLYRSGKVRYFGVSNHTAAQIELLQKYLHQPVITNQVEFNLIHTHLLDEGIMFNQNSALLTRNEGTIEYCRLHNITLQAWSPLARGRLTGNQAEMPTESFSEAAKMVAQMAQEKGVSPEAILIAWILRHPAHIQPIIGSTNPMRIKAACQGDGVLLNRDEWYCLFRAGRGEDLP